MKRITKTAIIAVILVLSFVFISFNASGFIFNNSSSEYDYTNSWTKAICNETHCQDYQIYCNEEKFVRQSPITGAVISIPENWEDPRNETMRERIC
jgi:hypothetical protein